MDPLKKCYIALSSEILSKSNRRESLREELPVFSRLINLYDAYKNLPNSKDLACFMKDLKVHIGEKCDSRFQTTFKTYSQQDAAEFFSLLLQIIEEEINSKMASLGLKIPNPIEQQFHYKLANQEKCSQCKKVTKLDPECTSTFHLQLTTDRALQTAFLERISPEESLTLCSDCKVPKTLEKSFEKLPKVLVFQAGRFNDGANSVGKDSSFFSSSSSTSLVRKDSGLIYASLNIYLPRSFITDEEFKQKADNNNNNNNNLPHCERYQLASIIVHIGSSTTSGHYVSYNYNFERSLWYKCNDTRVVEFELGRLMEETSENGLCYYYVHMNALGQVTE